MVKTFTFIQYSPKTGEFHECPSYPIHGSTEEQCELEFLRYLQNCNAHAFIYNQGRVYIKSDKIPESTKASHAAAYHTTLLRKIEHILTDTDLELSARVAQIKDVLKEGAA